jgi:hypothetical protein
VGALRNNTTASNNTAVGYQAGYANTTGLYNTLIGAQTGYSLTTGHGNTFIGGPSYTSCGRYITTGSKNTIIGGYDGNQSGLDIRTSSNNIVLSDGDGNPRVHINSSGYMALGKSSPGYMLDIYSGGSNAALRLRRDVDATLRSILVFEGTGSGTVGGIYVNTSSTSYNTSSDYRLKENVVAMTGATDRLKQLNPSRFNFIADADTTVDGFLAHEVQAVVPEAVTGAKDAVDADGNPEYQGIDQSKLVPLLVATIQELEARITALENA